MVSDYEIPVLGSELQPRLEKRSAKPGRRYSFPRFSIPPIRWTRYGCWTDDGSTVLNQHGQAIYRDALVPHIAPSYVSGFGKLTDVRLNLAAQAEGQGHG